MLITRAEGERKADAAAVVATICRRWLIRLCKHARAQRSGRITTLETVDLREILWATTTDVTGKLRFGIREINCQSPEADALFVWA